VLSLSTVLQLARAWYYDPRGRWRPRTLVEAQAILSSVGLVDDFWQLQG